MDSINHKDSVTFSRNILRANVCKISAKIVKLVIEISLFLALCALFSFEIWCRLVPHGLYFIWKHLFQFSSRWMTSAEIICIIQTFVI